MRLTSVIRWGLLASAGVFLLMGASALAVPMLVWVPGDAIFGGLLASVIFPLCALSCAAMIERGRLTPLMWSGIVAAGAALAGWSALALFGGGLPGFVVEAWAKLAMLPSGGAIWCALVGLLWRRRLAPIAASMTRWIAAGAAGAFIASLVGPMVFEFDGVDETLIKLVGVTGIVALAASMATMVLLRLRSLREGVADDEPLVRLAYEAVCPRCELRQPMTTGDGACSRCGLRIRVILP